MKILIYLIILLVVGCSTKMDDSSYHEFFVNFDRMKDSEDSEFFIDRLASCHLVQLETNENCLIGQIRKVIVRSDRIFILDEDIAMSVFIFDEHGNWINTISRFGRGPEEYLEVTDIYYDDENQQLCLLCRSNRKIMMFDRDGQYNRQEELPGIFKHIEKTENGYVVNAKNTRTSLQLRSNIVLLSPDFSVQNMFFPISDLWQSINLKSSTDFSTYKDKLYYFPVLDYNVYRITKDSISTAFSYDFGKHNLPEDWKFPDYFIPPLRINIMERQTYISGISFFKETDKYFICAVLFDGSTKLVFSSKEDKSTYPVTLHRNPFAHSVSFGSFSTITDDFIITYVQAESILSVMNDEKGWFADDVEGKKFLNREITRKISDRIEENPILCFYKLK